MKYICTRCGAEVTEGTSLCPGCGMRIDINQCMPGNLKRQDRPPKKKSSKILILSAIVVGIVGFVSCNMGAASRELKHNAQLEIAAVARDVEITSEPVDGIYIADKYAEGALLLNQNLDELAKADSFVYLPGADRFAYKLNGLWGLMDRDGNKITEAVYSSIESAPQNLLFSEKNENSENTILMNRDGMELAEGMDWMYSIQEVQGQVRISYAKIEDWGQEKWGIIDEKGNEIVPFEYSFIRFYQDGIIKLGIESGNGYKMYFVDVDGQELIDCTDVHWNRIGDYLGDGYIMVGESEKDNAVVTMETIYDRGKIYSEDTSTVKRGYAGINYLGNDLFALKEKETGKWGIRDAQGNRVWVFIYDEIISLADGLLGVRKGDSWGVHSLEGGELVPIMFEEVRYLSDDFFGVRLGGLWGVCNSEGAEVLPCEYESIDSKDDRSFCCLWNEWDEQVGVVSYSDKQVGEYHSWNFSNLDENTYMVDGNEYMLIETDDDIIVIGPNGQKIWNDTYIGYAPDQKGYMVIRERSGNKYALACLLTGEKEGDFEYVFPDYDAASGTYGVKVNGEIGIYQAGKGYLVEPSLNAAHCQVPGSNVARLNYKNLFSEVNYTVLFR